MYLNGTSVCRQHKLVNIPCGKHDINKICPSVLDDEYLCLIQKSQVECLQKYNDKLKKYKLNKKSNFI